LNLFSILNVAIILISTVGGFGAIFALVVTPQIRAWNRLSIYILFISLSGGAIVLSRFIQRIKNQNIFKIILILIGFFSIIEQKPENLPIDIDNYKMMIKDYKETKSFIEKIEESIDKGSMIFQLPYLMFPEGGVIRNLKPYQLVEGFLHTSGIRWSYGGTINRQSDIFNRAVSQLSVEKMIKVLVIVGFRGIYIDSRAYDYRDLDQLIKKIEDTVESKPLKSNNKILFYDLQKYGDHYLSLYKGKEIDKIKSELLNTLNIPSPWSGVYTFEGDSRWLNKDAVFIIYNPRQMKVEYDLKFSLNTKYEDYSDVTVNLNGMAINNYKINSLKRECYERIWLEPGQNTIQFKTNGKPYKIEGDKRELYIELNNLYPFSNIGLK
jgi:phosphoglycerol transferase